MFTIDRQDMTVADSRSDNVELPSVEVPDPDFETSPEKSSPILSSYTVDDRGLLNNYAILPPMYFEEPTSVTSKEQLYFSLKMLFPLLITAIAILIAFAVS